MISPCPRREMTLDDFPPSIKRDLTSTSFGFPVFLTSSLFIFHVLLITHYLAVLYSNNPCIAYNLTTYSTPYYVKQYKQRLILKLLSIPQYIFQAPFNLA